MTRKQRLTRKFFSLESLENRLCLSTLPVGTSTTAPDAATQAHLTAAYGQIPLSFEVNKGQTDPRVNFLTQGAGYTAFLTPAGAVMELQQANGGNVVTMKLRGANAGSHAVGLDKQAGVSNDFIGNDPSKWHTNIANYAEVAYKGVYRGINLVYHGDQQQLEYDFVVQPGASPGAIRLAFGGALGKSLDAQGDLVLHTSGGDMVEHAPVAYQVVNGVRHAVASRFVLGRDGQVSFQVGHHEHSKPLVIDPVLSLSYSTYLGRRRSVHEGRWHRRRQLRRRLRDGRDLVAQVSDHEGGFPDIGGLHQHDRVRRLRDEVQCRGIGAGVLHVSRRHQPRWHRRRFRRRRLRHGLDVRCPSPEERPSGHSRRRGRCLRDETQCQRLRARLLHLSRRKRAGLCHGHRDRQVGRRLRDGRHRFHQLPDDPGFLAAGHSGAEEAFVSELNPAGSALVYSTYLGGTAESFANGIAVDRSGNAYVTGWSPSANFPTTPGAFQSGSSGGAFVAKLNATGSALVYAAQLADGKGSSIAVDGSGNAYVTGIATSPDFPTTAGAFQTTFGTPTDAFVTELNAAGTALVYSTRLGGSGGASFLSTFPGGIAVDSSGNIHVTGITGSTNFPTKNALQAAYGGGEYDAFVAEINPSQVGAASLVYSTYLGGSDEDEADGIALDGSGNAYVTGFSFSLDFPTRNAYQPQRTAQTTKHASIGDAFVTKITFN